MSSRPDRSPELVSSAGLALLAFALNSILCRAALGTEAIDATPFTWLRLSAGAGFLALVVRWRNQTDVVPRTTLGTIAPWWGALALTVYAAAFSFAYLRLAAGTGALVLFAVTQVTMIGWGVGRGDRPTATEWVGVAVALGGLVALTAPGRTAPDHLGVLLMAVAGVGWGAYSLLGRRALDPVAANAAAFLRAAILATGLLLLPSLGHAVGRRGALLAIASGALASGLGYCLWYRALPHLSRTRAAAVQLAVPVITATLGVLFLDETVTPRLLASGTVILGGVGLVLVGRVPAR
ncbi:MAG TPA: DMT family transporter [Vicinamibacteria bacterium]